jgi:hypothetical protein
MTLFFPAPGVLTVLQAQVFFFFFISSCHW